MQSYPFSKTYAAGSPQDANALQGSPIQYWGKAGVLTVYGNGNTGGDPFNLSINDGQENRNVIPQGSLLGAASTAGKVKTNEDFIGQFPIPAGVQLILPITPIAAGDTVNFLFVIT